VRRLPTLEKDMLNSQDVARAYHYSNKTEVCTQEVGLQYKNMPETGAQIISDSKIQFLIADNTQFCLCGLETP